MSKTPFKRILRPTVPQKKAPPPPCELQGIAPGLKPWETKDIASSGEKVIAPDAAEPSPDADRPKSSCPDVGVAGVGDADSGQSGSSSDTGADSRQSDEENGIKNIGGNQR